MATGNRLYSPSYPQNLTPEVLPQYIFEELNRISQALEQSRYNQTYDSLSVEPERPIEGLQVTADGTNWDPGNGAGPYQYIGGSWVAMFDTGGGGSTSWGSITGTLSDQTDLQTELDATEDASNLTSGTLADARVAQSNVTQHQTALSITESQISDLQAYSVIDFFQVEDDGSTGQTTTGTYVDLAGMWATPSLNTGNFSWNGTTGVLTADATGTLELDVHIMTTQTANNRLQLDFDVQIDTGGGYSTVLETNNYSSRNNTQSEGGGYIPGYKVAVTSGDNIKIRIKDTGVAASVGTGAVAGNTYISAKLYT